MLWPFSTFPWGQPSMNISADHAPLVQFRFRFHYTICALAGVSCFRKRTRNNFFFCGFALKLFSAWLALLYLSLLIYVSLSHSYILFSLCRSVQLFFFAISAWFLCERVADFMCASCVACVSRGIMRLTNSKLNFIAAVLAGVYDLIKRRAVVIVKKKRTSREKCLLGITRIFDGCPKALTMHNLWLALHIVAFAICPICRYIFCDCCLNHGQACAAAAVLWRTFKWVTLRLCLLKWPKALLLAIMNCSPTPGARFNADLCSIFTGGPPLPLLLNHFEAGCKDTKPIRRMSCKHLEGTRASGLRQLNKRSINASRAVRDGAWLSVSFSEIARNVSQCVCVPEWQRQLL